MTETELATSLANRLVNELMLVSVLVAGDGADALAAALSDAGAAADILSGTQPPEGYDLALLLAPAGAATTAAMRATVESLARASDRLLLAPTPLGAEGDGDGPALPELPQWFELFAELGYQPVVEFDARFISAGAFLVDRAATAAEGDLAAFTDRLQLGAEAAAAQREAVADAERSVRTELATARAALAAREAELATLHEAARQHEADLAAAATHAATLAEAARQAEATLRDIEARNAGWDGLRGWVRLDAAAAHRNTPAALARDLPALNALRAPDLPPVALPAPPKRRIAARLLGRLARRAAPPQPLQLLADAALIRASPLFDAPWYIASSPALAESALDPVFHYLLVGGPRGADPGPWFDTASYLQTHPGCTGVPLVEAVRNGEVDVAAQA